VTTLRGNHAKTSRAAAERNAPDMQGLQQVYQENLGPIYRYVYSWVRNHEDAEDLTSCIFLKAGVGVDYGCPPKMIRRWLFQVARTTLADHWRARYRFATYSLEVLLDSGEHESTEAESRVSSNERTDLLQRLLARLSTRTLEEYFDADWAEPVEAELTASFNSAAGRVQRLLQAMPEQYREVLTCRFLLNLSIRDTALRLGLTEANVKVVQLRALKYAVQLENIARD
jgi:RNA polymerase sigma-70 factor, ECF subfamily